MSARPLGHHASGAIPRDLGAEPLAGPSTEIGLPEIGVTSDRKSWEHQVIMAAARAPPGLALSLSYTSIKHYPSDDPWNTPPDGGAGCGRGA